jgi:3-dehydroquinate synthase
VVKATGLDHVSLRGVETIPGGEACKDGLAHAERVARACFESGVSRRGAVIAIGGGAVLDAVGFGAAMAHRGVPVIRVPTTTLSQDDSAMGVKCGVNAFGQKNALGAFAAPHAVICCERLLASLSLEHWLGGFSEAVKIALLKDPDLLATLERDAARIRARDMHAARPVLRRCAELHRAHVRRSAAGECRTARRSPSASRSMRTSRACSDCCHRRMRAASSPCCGPSDCRSSTRSCGRSIR